MFLRSLFSYFSHKRSFCSCSWHQRLTNHSLCWKLLQFNLETLDELMHFPNCFLKNLRYMRILTRFIKNFHIVGSTVLILRNACEWFIEQFVVCIKLVFVLRYVSLKFYQSFSFRNSWHLLHRLSLLHSEFIFRDLIGWWGAHTIGFMFLISQFFIVNFHSKKTPQSYICDCCIVLKRLQVGFGVVISEIKTLLSYWFNIDVSVRSWIAFIN